MIALLSGDPATGVAVLTLRPTSGALQLLPGRESQLALLQAAAGRPARRSVAGKSPGRPQSDAQCPRAGLTMPVGLLRGRRSPAASLPTRADAGRSTPSRSLTAVTPLRATWPSTAGAERSNGDVRRVLWRLPFMPRRPRSGSSNSCGCCTKPPKRCSRTGRPGFRTAWIVVAIRRRLLTDDELDTRRPAVEQLRAVCSGPRLAGQLLRRTVKVNRPSMKYDFECMKGRSCCS